MHKLAIAVFAAASGLLLATGPAAAEQVPANLALCGSAHDMTKINVSSPSPLTSPVYTDEVKKILEEIAAGHAAKATQPPVQPAPAPLTTSAPQPVLDPHIRLLEALVERMKACSRHYPAPGAWSPSTTQGTPSQATTPGTWSQTTTTQGTSSQATTPATSSQATPGTWSQANTPGTWSQGTTSGTWSQGTTSGTWSQGTRPLNSAERVAFVDWLASTPATCAPTAPTTSPVTGLVWWDDAVAFSHEVDEFLADPAGCTEDDGFTLTVSAQERSTGQSLLEFIGIPALLNGIFG
ncbi:hypothetical protein ETD86_25850 [Nonomuraea turkmeniaca]|uniref:Uncharacterized protein n=1 Tax=Nonomuraea turkmeniaca TaxID=103838 RepID=A0A5S4FCQ0_9ACTN|nr:hypothetical protein [Nonomuraea turkmeniaca]TMR16097.1 hypothetical protein ETD86_25850 [Nonomuraea turkmeniaca]